MIEEKFKWSKGERRTRKDNTYWALMFNAKQNGGKALWNPGRISDRAEKRAVRAMRKAALKARG